MATSAAIDEEHELGAACPNALEACGPRLTPSCRVSCQPAGDGCANVWELYRLDVVPANAVAEWVGFDSEGRYGIFVRYQRPPSCPSCVIEEEEDQPPPVPTEYFLWSATGGVVPVSPGDASLTLGQVSADGSAALGQLRGGSVYWSLAAGVQPVPLERAAMSRDGHLLAGLLDGGGARWTAAGGVTDAFQLESLHAAAAEGTAAVFVAATTLVYNPAPGEHTFIPLPPGVSPEARFEQAVLAANGTSFVVRLRDGDDVQLYRWAGGALEHVQLPPWAPGYSEVDSRISDDGRVIVAALSAEQGWREPPLQLAVRWSAEAGTQILSEDPTFSIQHVSSSGDVIFGGVTVEGYESDYTVTSRWSPDDGMVELGPGSVGERLAFDGDVLVATDDDGVLLHKFDGAVGVPLPLDHLRGRLVPQRPFWMFTQRVSPNARMLGGTGTDDPGNTWVWVARLQTVCTNVP